MRKEVFKSCHAEFQNLFWKEKFRDGKHHLRPPLEVDVRLTEGVFDLEVLATSIECTLREWDDRIIKGHCINGKFLFGPQCLAPELPFTDVS